MKLLVNFFIFSGINLISCSTLCDLSMFKLQLPIGPKYNEVKVIDNLAGFQNEYFYQDKSIGAYVFHVPVKPRVNAAHTPNSKTTRTELRERKNWDYSTGHNSLHLVQSVNRVTKNLKKVIIAQIFGNGPLLIIQYLAGSLYARTHGQNGKQLIGNVQLGEKFALAIVVENSVAKVYFNGKQKAEVKNKGGKSVYFKAGAYGGSTIADDDADDVNEVLIYDIKVEHSPNKKGYQEIAYVDNSTKPDTSQPVYEEIQIGFPSKQYEGTTKPPAAKPYKNNLPKPYEKKEVTKPYKKSETKPASHSKPYERNSKKDKCLKKY